MTIKKLSAHPYAQAHVEINDNGDVYLWSYNTLVALITENWLIINGLYSATTRRHIGAFCKEYANCDYHTAKQLYYDNMIMNIETGEVLDKS